jgi:hypothetical protein
MQKKPKLLLTPARTSTLEHVVEKRNGGGNDLDNLVVACSICNELRSRYGMTAYEFSDWAPLHLDVIEQAAQLREERHIRRFGFRPKKKRAGISPDPSKDSVRPNAP